MVESILNKSTYSHTYRYNKEAKRFIVWELSAIKYKERDLLRITSYTPNFREKDKV